ncbi:hypothetical protein [Halanaerobium sp. ST460_2HS_T2]|uniref:hypothetical protein n=1 Tax=Halanaerobium sp. ST460_2HS_T2 TaxID=2183914 RepID=UPI000DF328AF|nr:hypothetical protein [Halanaerobium sp. ST460_2HS_T2]RCW52333.1 hypothetical protein DFR80_13025 [Halanaerobium sp. ST460_2HS_T2]
MIRLKNIIFYINLLFIIILILTLEAAAVGVRPMIFEFDLDPGEIKEFEFVLTPGEQRQNVELNLYTPTQNLTGGLNYNLGNPEINPVLNWISLESKEVIIPASQEQVVSGVIQVPYNASGSHTAIIMIEPLDNQDNQNNSFFNFTVRYAVRININIDRPGQRPRAEIVNIYLEQNEEGIPEISALIKNTDSINFIASAEATLRDKNNRLIEKLDIISEIAARNNSLATRIYPSSEVIFKGELNQPLYPGDYNLQVHLRYGDNLQLIERKVITLKEELRRSGPRRYISYEPEIISKNLRAGSPTTQVIEINNLYNEKIKVKINREEVVDNFDYSIFNTGELQLRGGEELVINNRNSERLVFIYRSIRDAVAGGYYGKLKLDVYSQEDKLLETRNINLEMLIGEGWKYNAEVERFNFINDNGVQTFSLNLKNLSSIHINPAVLLVIKNDEEQIIKTINLSPSEEYDNKLLPEKTVSMMQRTTGIEPGNYQVEIIITDNGKEIKKTATSVDIN